MLLLFFAVIAATIGVLVLLTKLNNARLAATLRQTMTPTPEPVARPWRLYADAVDTVDGESRALTPWQPSPAPEIQIPTTAPAGWEVSRWTPTRAPTPASDLAVPLGQAFGLALAVGIGGGLIAWALSWSWRVIAIGAGATLVLAVLWRLRVADGLLQVVEQALGTDLNHDGAIGKPAFAHLAAVNAPMARSQVAQSNRAAEDAAQLKELETFVGRCYAVGTSESAQSILPGQRADYLQKRDLLFSLGLATWRAAGKPRLGWRMMTTKEQALDIIRRHVVSVGTTTNHDRTTTVGNYRDNPRRG